jgi:hypothetical protein
MYCQSCGKETPDQGIFCLHCGTRLNKECPRCAEIVRHKAKVCRFCGYEFTPEEIAKVEQEEQERVLRLERERLLETEKREKEKREKERERREQEEEEKKKKEWEEEYSRWHRPEVVSTWGSTVFQCPQCSILNSLKLQSCRRCSASLKSAPKVKNPYL